MFNLFIGALVVVLATGYAADQTAHAEKIVGTREANSIQGTERNDTIDARGGDDRVSGRGGNDTIRGQTGQDRVQGDDGNDVLKGNGGNDVLQGGGGDDEIDGGSGNDIIRGGLGSDVLRGQNGADTIRGDSGNDRIEGGPGPDKLTGGSGADQFVYSKRENKSDQILDFRTGQKDSLLLEGTLRGGALRFTPRGADTKVRVYTVQSGAFQPLTVLKNTSVPIDVWYGNQQEFGSPGEAQQWVNILGRVAMKDITSLTYSLNGGAPLPLRPGPDGVRLQKLGDFNVELDYAELDPSPANDVVRIEATYKDGQRFVETVTIEYEAGQSWPQTYAIKWSEVTNLQDVVQVVDGNWAFGDQGVRPAEPGYDRLLVMGDADWDSYTVRTTFVVKSWDSPVEGRALWFGSQWGGHTDNPEAGEIPHVGYIPLTTFMIQNNVVVIRPSEFFEDGTNEMKGVTVDIVAGKKYNVLIRNQRVSAVTGPQGSEIADRNYSIKIWPVGSPEPNGFLISATMTDQEAFGAFCIFPHYVDATIGDVTVRKIPAAAGS